MDLLGFGWLRIEVVAHGPILPQQPVHGDPFVAAVAEIPIQSAHQQNLAIR